MEESIDMKTGTDEKIEMQVEALLEQLTLDEKITMIHGAGFFKTAAVDRLGIPALKTSDGPMGVRNEFENNQWIPLGLSDDYVTYLPSNSALASTWNKDLAYEMGQVLGAEARGRGKDVILAPGINIKRSPLCGRNFEYLSEDPKVVEEMVVPLIKGIQENDVAACVKHYAANAQETDRLFVDTIVDERTLREIYLPGFKAAVEKADTYSLMCAYNMVNGERCSEQSVLLDQILRDEWGYDGTVISDWSAVMDTKGSAEVSLDIEMSVFDNFDDYYFARPLKDAILAGKIDEQHIDRKVRNVLRMMLRLKMIGDKKEERKGGIYNSPEHRAQVLKIARESIVLLKNEDKKLPLDGRKLKKVAVIGQNAERVHANGGGSGEIKALYEISPLMGLKIALGGNVEVKYAKGYVTTKKVELRETNWQANTLSEVREEEEKRVAGKAAAEKEQFEKHGEESHRLLKEAVALAEECDEVIIVGGLNHDYDMEEQDRAHMKLPYGQDDLIKAVLAVKPDAVITIVAGSPVEMPWAEDAKAIVWCYYAGMETGNALADILLGRCNPSGKLAETFPTEYKDTPTYENGQFAKMYRVEFEEGIFVGYRYYEARDKKPAFCFGHGLSYTTFQYHNLTLQKQEADDDVKVTVTFEIENTGDMAGGEAVQIYVSEIAPALERPVKELKGFQKVFIKPGSKTMVSITLEKDAFGYYDTENKSFLAKAGEYEIIVASASDAPHLKAGVQLTKDYYY